MKINRLYLFASVVLLFCGWVLYCDAQDPLYDIDERNGVYLASVISFLTSLFLLSVTREG